MAHCSVLEAHQNISERPSKRIKRSGGHSLVRRGLAIWIREHVLLKMKPADAVQTLSIPLRTPYGRCKSFIPDKLPSNIDNMLGVIVKAPVLANQVRYRPFPLEDQRSNPAY